MKIVNLIWYIIRFQHFIPCKANFLLYLITLFNQIISISNWRLIHFLIFLSKLALIAVVKESSVIIAPDLDVLLIKARTPIRIIEKLVATIISWRNHLFLEWWNLEEGVGKISTPFIQIIFQGVLVLGQHLMYFSFLGMQ